MPIKGKKYLTKERSRIIAAYAKDPLATNRKIAEVCDVNPSTVTRAIRHCPQLATKDQRIIDLSDSDYDLQVLIQEEKFKRLEKSGTISNSDLNLWDRHSADRYSKLRGAMTNSDGGYNQLYGIIMNNSEGLENLDKKLIETMIEKPMLKQGEQELDEHDK